MSGLCNGFQRLILLTALQSSDLDLLGIRRAFIICRCWKQYCMVWIWTVEVMEFCPPECLSHHLISSGNFISEGNMSDIHCCIYDVEAVKSQPTLLIVMRNAVHLRPFICFVHYHINFLHTHGLCSLVYVMNSFLALSIGCKSISSSALWLFWSGLTISGVG